MPQWQNIYSDEFQREMILDAQTCVLALASYDLASDGNIHAAAAFGLLEQDPALLAQGNANWSSFLSEAQSHLHSVFEEMPIAWGALGEVSPVPQCVLGPTMNAATSPPNTWEHVEPPPTLWLAGRLRGGAGIDLRTQVAKAMERIRLRAHRQILCPKSRCGGCLPELSGTPHRRKTPMPPQK